MTMNKEELEIRIKGLKAELEELLCHYKETEIELAKFSRIQDELCEKAFRIKPVLNELERQYYGDKEYKRMKKKEAKELMESVKNVKESNVQ